MSKKSHSVCLIGNEEYRYKMCPLRVMGKIEIEGTKMSFSWGPKVCFETAAGDFFLFQTRLSTIYLKDTIQRPDEDFWYDSGPNFNFFLNTSKQYHPC